MLVPIRTRMAWSKMEHRLIAVRDAKRLTGLAAAELLEQRGVQALTRIHRGSRQAMLRVPLELLLEQPVETKRTSSAA
jgi:hypothetical protein